MQYRFQKAKVTKLGISKAQLNSKIDKEQLTQFNHLHNHKKLHERLSELLCP